jgi:glutathione-regulated potassium-efflux system ancillary protein KefF
MSKVVIISGHPNLDASYTNNIILDKAAKGIDSVRVNELVTADLEAEELLEEVAA